MNKPFPWDISENDFPKDGTIEEQSKFLLSYAILAPSSHNMQPWLFSIDKNKIYISPDYSRSLPYSDRAQRELFLSIGCALENLVIAANHYDFDVSITYLPEDQIEDVAVKLTLMPTQKMQQNPLFPFIVKRQTNRFLYKEENLDKTILFTIAKEASIENVSAYFITDKTKKNTILDLIVETTKFAFDDKIFRSELAPWVSSAYTKRKDGIPLYDFGIPGPFTILPRQMILHVPTPMQVSMDKRMFAKVGAYVVILSKFDNKEHWIKAGRVFEKTALLCAKYGFAIAPFGGIAEYEKAAEKLKIVLGTKQIPTFFARIGHTNKTPPHTPRRSVEEVLRKL